MGSRDVEGKAAVVISAMRVQPPAKTWREGFSESKMALHSHSFKAPGLPDLHNLYR